MSYKSNKKKLLFDTILVAALLAFSISAYFIVNAFLDKGDFAVVYVNGKESSRYALLIDGEYVLNGGTNILKIENGTARMIYGDCPKQICVNTGAISLELQCISCNHNRVDVRIIKN